MKNKEKYTGKSVSKAGERLRDPTLFDEVEEFSKVMDILSYWRFTHEKPLDRSLKLLEEITLKIDKDAIFAKRLKRYISIHKKLLRFKDMKLKNMQDIGGCRAIVSTNKKLIQVVRALKRRPEFRDATGKIRQKNYILRPKNDGYRSYHLIGRFEDELGELKSIEFQIRTRLQHDWATALEIVDLFTRQSLKSNEGQDEWMRFFKAVSEQFAVMEDIHLFSLENIEKTNQYREKVNSDTALRLSCLNIRLLSNKLGVINKLEGFANSIKIVEDKLKAKDGYVLIEINMAKNEVRTTIFDNNQNDDAKNEYVEAEKRSIGQEKVVALVYASSVGEIKEVYPNYFADSTDFIEHLILIHRIELH